jgi:hypothetical protein
LIWRVKENIENLRQGSWCLVEIRNWQHPYASSVHYLKIKSELWKKKGKRTSFWGETFWKVGTWKSEKAKKLHEGGSQRSGLLESEMGGTSSRS